MKILSIIFFAIIIYGCASTGDYNQTTSKTDETKNKNNPNIIYGIDITDFDVETKKISQGQSFWKILKHCGLNSTMAEKLSDSLQQNYNIKKVKQGNNYTLIKTRDNNIKYVVYQNNKAEYIIINLEKFCIIFYNYPEKNFERKIGLTIENNIWKTIKSAKINPQLLTKLEQKIGKSINFSDIKDGDELKIVFNEKRINDTVFNGIGDIKMAWFNNCGTETYAFPLHCTADNAEHWFNADGKILNGKNNCKNENLNSVPENYSKTFKDFRDSCIMVLNQVEIIEN